jgi:hypothetical protein
MFFFHGGLSCLPHAWVHVFFKQREQLPVLQPSQHFLKASAQAWQTAWAKKGGPWGSPFFRLGLSVSQWLT